MKTKCLLLLFFLIMVFFFAAHGQERKETVTSLYEIGDSLSIQRRYQEALHYFLEASKIAQPSSDSLVLNSIYYNIGLQYIKLGKNTEAFHYFSKSDSLCKSIQNDSCRSMALHALGQSKATDLAYDAALRYYEAALALQEEKVKDPRTEAVILNGLLGVYMATQDFTNTLHFAQKALVKSQEAEDFELQANILNTISLCFEEKKEYREALKYKQKSLRVCEKHLLIIPIVLLANIGNNYFLLEELDSALYYYNVASQKAIETNNDYGLARINFNKGKVYQASNQYEYSLSHFNESYAYFKEINDKPMLNLASKRISELYEDLGHMDQALLFLKEHLQWNDTIAERSSEKKLEEFQAKYETQRKEERIVTLETENKLKSKIIQQEKQKKYWMRLSFIIILTFVGLGWWYWQYMNKKRILAKQENLRFKAIIEGEQQERKRIAQELHDGLGQSISALKMQVSTLHIPEKEIGKHHILLKQVDDAYDELRNISHNIMPNTLIRLGLLPALRELAYDMETDGSPKIRIESKGEIPSLEDEQVFMIYRIVQEAVVNSIKHAGASLISIYLENKNGLFSLQVNDDGAGIDVAALKNNPGLGWKNILSRIALISGHIDIKSQPNQGTSITISMKPSDLKETV